MLRKVVLAALAGTLAAVFVGIALRSAPHRSAAPSRAAIGAALGRLPVAFEQNLGQAGRGTSFVAHRSDYELLIKPTGLTMLLSRNQLPGRRALPKKQTALAPVDLSLETLGSNPFAHVSGVARLRGVVNYFHGSRADWVTGVPTFSGVRVHQLYPGIDLTYTGTQDRIEYDFTVEAGANPQAIRLGVSGAQGLRIDSAGNLLAGTAAGSVVEHAPLAYQTIAGKRHPVPVRFTLRRGTVGFRVGSYDRSVPLLIDPVVTYSTYLSGTDGETTAYGVAVDPTSGDIVVTGPTNSYSFVGGPAYNPVDQDAYLISLDPTGSTVIYTDYLGGSGDDEATAVALDSSGNAYITGFTDSPEFPVTVPRGTLDDDQTYGHDFDAFLTELNGADGSFMYGTFLGGTQDDEGEAIAIGPGDSVYVTGLTASTNDFPTTTGAFEEAPLSRPYYAAFVEKFEPDGFGGETLDYSTLVSGKQASAAFGPGTGLTEGTGIAVDSSGDAWITGLTLTTNFPTTPGGFSTSMGNALSSAFVSELDPTGSSLYYSSYLGSTAFGSRSQGTAIALSGTKVVVVGSTNGGGFPVSTGAFQSSHSGSRADAFVSELDPAQHGAAQLVYSTYLGGSDSDLGEGVAVDQTNGDIYVTGQTESTDFPVVNAFSRTLTLGGNAFVSRLDPSLSGSSSLVWSSFLGGGGDAGYGIAVPSSGHELVVGRTVSQDFPTVNALQGSNGNVLSAGFLTEIADGPTVLVNTSPPTVSGTIALGQVLTGALGTWTISASDGTVTRARQWLQCDQNGANCNPIAGATGTNYGVRKTDIGLTLRFQVTESNASANVTAVSDPTVIVGAPQNISPPTVSGTLAFGQILTGAQGTWSTAVALPLTKTQAWLRCDANGENCSPISSATKYSVKTADIGSTLRFQVTESNVAATVAVMSDPTAIVGAPSNISPPVVTGTAGLGLTLTGSLGTWSTAVVNPVGRSRQWLQCDVAGLNCNPIGGATAATYVVKVGDVGFTLRMQVTESNEAGTVSAMSAQTVIVGAPRNISPPTVSGTATLGQTLTGGTGTWSSTAVNPVSTSRQWWRCDAVGANCVVITGSTGTNYTVRNADLGHTLQFQVTKSNTVLTVTAGSTPTAVVTR